MADAKHKHILGPEWERLNVQIIDGLEREIAARLDRACIDTAEYRTRVRCALNGMFSDRLNIAVLSRGEVSEMLFLAARLFGPDERDTGALFLLDSLADKIVSHLVTTGEQENADLRLALSCVLDEQISSDHLVRSEIYRLYELLAKFLCPSESSRPGDVLSGTQKLLDDEFEFAGFSLYGRAGFTHIATKRTLWVEVAHDEVHFGTIDSLGEFEWFPRIRDALRWVRGT